MSGAAGDPRGRLGIALLAGALLGTLLEVALLMLGSGLGRLRALAPDEQALLRFVFGGGWFAFPVAGAGVGAGVAAAFAAGTARTRAVVAAAALLALPFALRPAIRTFEDARPPRGERATVLALTRWTFRSPRTLARVLPYAAARDPVVREQAMLALGENLVVDDFEHATAGRPPRDPAPGLRARMRDTLLASLARDPAEGVRAEAARALWKAPHAYGVHVAAAETLAAILDRATRPQALERLTWLALDAAAGRRDPGLLAAAARFAAATPDSELARVARLAAARGVAPAAQAGASPP